MLVYSYIGEELIANSSAPLLLRYIYGTVPIMYVTSLPFCVEDLLGDVERSTRMCTVWFAGNESE